MQFNMKSKIDEQTYLSSAAHITQFLHPLDIESNKRIRINLVINNGSHLFQKVLFQTLVSPRNLQYPTLAV